MAHRYQFLILFSILLLVGGAIWVASSPNNPHDFSGQCETCHLQEPQQQGETLIFNHDIDYLCNYCHEIPGANSHPSQIFPSMAMPKGFPLDWQGRMTCATCHDPHLEAWGINPQLLRGGVTGRLFCALCHTNLQEPGAEHHIAEIVHAQNALSPTQEEISGSLDRISIECLSCHDGNIGKVIDIRVAGGELLTFEGQTLSHPIGMNYQETQQQTKNLRPVESLSPLITLIDGKVGCSSCHNQYSTEPDILTMSNRGSALCLECHDK